MVAGEGRADVRGYRFMVRQYEWALAIGDPLPRIDPFRIARRWTVVSFCCAAVLLAGFGVVGLIHPAPRWQDAAVLLDTDSGTVFVNRDGVLHPALNLTSALLAADGAGTTAPKRVSSADIADAPRGALLGIVGAPGRLPAADSLIGDQWSVCDQQGMSTVIIGEPSPGVALRSDQGLLVRGGGAEYLIWNGSRARIDRSDPVLAQALRLDGVPVRTLSIGLLNAIPETTPLTVPAVAGAGSATAGFSLGAGAGGALPVGTIFRVLRAAGGTTLHLVESDGVEQISPLTADLLQLAGAALEPQPVPARILASVPTARLQLVESAARPPVAPDFLIDEDVVICSAWSRASGWHVLVAAGWSPDHVVALPEPRPAGAVAAVVIAPSRGAVVRGAGSQVVLVTDLGIVYPVGNPETLTRLGFPTDPPSAPPELLRLLPAGPTLDAAAAGHQWGGLPDVRPSTESVGGELVSTVQTPTTALAATPMMSTN